MTEKNPAAQALGRLGRAKNTEAQQAAAKANGAKGGRPVGLKYSLSVHSLNRIRPLAVAAGLRFTEPPKDTQFKKSPDGRVLITVRVHKDDLEAFKKLHNP